MRKKKPFKVIINALLRTLEEKQPQHITPSWVLINTPSAYRYIQKHIRTPYGTIDWDRVTQSLDPNFVQRWQYCKSRKSTPHNYQHEVDQVCSHYKDVFHVLLTHQDKKDRATRDEIIICLVRLAQRGNTVARDEITQWITFITNHWIDRYPQLYKWQGYPDEVISHIHGCIHRYRYTGSFLGYLFKTLEYSARGKPSLVSIDDEMFDGNQRRIDFISD